MGLLRRSRRLLCLLPFTFLLGRSACQALHYLYELYVLLRSRLDVLHVGDVVHQVFVGVVSLQSDNEYSCSDIIATIIDNAI